MTDGERFVKVLKEKERREREMERAEENREQKRELLDFPFYFLIQI
jgi:hypothetical protein